ncbi:5'-3' exoribonuclease [Eubacterium plexicaudatum ASF492]|uniref:Polymerase/histidinol phosphatase N-terminal domain-containing protein n=1 Tax=Eubacterium plexicaudatum ASF492 TaxID=1235802 RepID=N2BDP7_9FIRM|nr:5'-3' exoribonuclease [Eubacterium plexicaudatum ASF492]
MTDTRIIDMHVHSSASDGTFAPAALLSEAKKAGLYAMALTDHDTMDGVEEAAAAAKELDIELVPGVEISTEYQDREIHVLGYYVSPEYPRMKAMLEKFRDFRSTRNVRMVQRLQEEGFSITMEQLTEKFPDSVLTRAHMSRFLCETGQIPDTRTAFAKYLGENCCCYIDRPKISPVEAVTLILEAGGLAVLAHPVLCDLEEHVLRQMIAEMKEAGMCGLEAVYSENTAEDEIHMKQLAEEFGLLITGGSDFHGKNKPDIKLGTGKGNLYIPYAFLQSLKELKKNEKN